MASLTEHTTAVEPDSKPLMTTKQIMLMNFGFFGVQYSFGMQQTAVNPVFGFLHADPGSLPLLNLAGPMCGLLIQPLIGAMSDSTWSPRWGRRKPFFILGAIGCSIGLFLFPFVAALWMAVLLLWLLDASNNTAMEPYRAFLADKLPDSQLAKGFLTQAFFTGFGITLANVSLFVFQKILSGTTDAGIPYWVFGSFMLGSVCSIGSILVSVLSTKEDPPTAAELAELRSRSHGPAALVKEIASAVKDMPASLHKLGLVYLFQWYAIVVYWQYVSFSIAKSVWNATENDTELYSRAVGWTGLVNGFYNIVTFSTAFALVTMARRYGAKWVHGGCLVLAAIALLIFPNIHNQYLLFAPMIGLGIAWASMMGVPYIMVVSMVPKARYGVYMGIINMMIVVPMLIQTVTFGWIYNHLLDANPNNALMFSGALFLCAAVATTWIRPPKKQSHVLPLTFRSIMDYDRVVVGSDGSRSSMRAVARAAEIASAAEAQLFVTSAYSVGTPREQAIPAMALGRSTSEALPGEVAAMNALLASMDQVNTERLKAVHRLPVEGEPAEALLKIAVEHHADLIVVGNRGVGALAGQLLGSVPAEVVRNAPCDVLIVQTEHPVAPAPNSAAASSAR